MLRTSISLDDNTVKKLDRIQNRGGYSNRSSTITGIINDYENAILQLEILQEYFRVTRGMINPQNELLKQKEDNSELNKNNEALEGNKKSNSTDPTIKNFDKFKRSYDNIPD